MCQHSLGVQTEAVDILPCFLQYYLRLELFSKISFADKTNFQVFFINLSFVSRGKGAKKKIK